MGTERKAVRPNEVQVIPFNGSEIHTVLINDEPHVVLKPTVESMGLDYSTQVKKLKDREWATVGQSPTVGADGRSRSMVTVDLDTWALVLASIDERRVAPHLREGVVFYKRESGKALRKFWTVGAVIRASVSEENLPSVVSQAVADYRTERERFIAEDEAHRLSLARTAEAQMSLINAAATYGFVDPHWARTKASVVMAKGLGEVASVPNEDLPLYTQDFMKSKRVKTHIIKRYSGAFGGKVAKKAVEEGLELPGKRDEEAPNGQLRPAYAWTRKHLPLFERAWEASYAHDERIWA